MSKRSLFRTIQKIYERLPEIECKGDCHDQCTVISFSEAEALRIRTKHGSEPEFKSWKDPKTGRRRMKCSKLNGKTKKCTIYEDRPMICRLYGLTKRLQCEHGCVPDEWISDEEAYRLLSKLEKLDRE